MARRRWAWVEIHDGEGWRVIGGTMSRLRNALQVYRRVRTINKMPGETPKRPVRVLDEWRDGKRRGHHAD